MIYRYNKIKETKLYIPTLYSTNPSMSLLATPSLLSSTSAPLPANKTFTLFEIIDILELLERTHQIPTRSRTGPITQYPVREYGIRKISQGIQESLEDAKLATVIKSEQIKYIQALLDSHQQYTHLRKNNHLSTSVSSVKPSIDIPILTPLETKKLIFIMHIYIVMKLCSLICTITFTPSAYTTGTKY